MSIFFYFFLFALFLKVTFNTVARKDKCENLIKLTKRKKGDILSKKGKITVTAGGIVLNR